MEIGSLVEATSDDVCEMFDFTLAKLVSISPERRQHVPNRNLK
jgi:hypothetical protein